MKKSLLSKIDLVVNMFLINKDKPLSKLDILEQVKDRVSETEIIVIIDFLIKDEFIISVRNSDVDGGELPWPSYILSVKGRTKPIFGKYQTAATWAVLLGGFGGGVAGLYYLIEMVRKILCLFQCH